MTEAEIMKAFNIVLSNKKGEKFTFALQSLQTIKQVLKDYNRINAEIERLEKNLKEAHLDIKEHLAEIERLKDKYSIIYAPKGRIQDEARAEAIKEFAERLKEKYKMHFGKEWNAVYNPIDQIAKEMGVSL